MRERLRIAFLTTEFVTEFRSAGGIASHLDRVARTLYTMGHGVDVFVLTKRETGVSDYGGIRVERVGYAWGALERILFRFFWRVCKRRPPVVVTNLMGAAGMARAFKRRRREVGYDVVHSFDYGLPGFFVKGSPSCPHATMCCWAADLCYEVARETGNLSWGGPFEQRIALIVLRRFLQSVDVVYAPSKFVADHYSIIWGIHVHVVRPTIAQLEVCEESDLLSIPDRFLFHFGQIGTLKGSDTIAAALLTVWREEPDFTMVWAGSEIVGGTMDQYRSLWGQRAGKVLWLGSVERQTIYHLIGRAIACVLPSRVDNLPNTVIESVILGAPVIGSKGASIDELVEDGVNGELAPIGDSEALAEIMLRAWRGEGYWAQRIVKPPSILREMEPEVAVANLLKLTEHS